MGNCMVNYLTAKGQSIFTLFRNTKCYHGLYRGFYIV